MQLRFGTDGVRGPALTQLTEEFVARLAFAATQVLGAQRFVVGADTRESSPQLTTALIRGAQAAGAEVIDLGTVATPVVSYACDIWNCSGAMVSASHNPWTDNGVKLFARGGTKLTTDVEQAIARQLDQPAAKPDLASPNLPNAQPASEHTPAEALLSYERSLRAGIGDRTLDGVRLVIDTANGATAPYAADMLRRLGADVVAMFDSPNGRNINEGCGSLHPQALQAEVVSRGADLGMCFDGDGDRLIAVDDDGNLINGDRLLVLFARDLAATAQLAHRTLVSTVMANLGMREALAAADINFVETQVGDRYVLNAIDEGGFDLGGEQSGHIIFRRLAKTGDGLRSGVHLADLLLRTADQAGQAGSALGAARLADSAMAQYPQVLKNVAVPTIWQRLPAELESELEKIQQDDTATPAHSRFLVRPSGTEPLVRVMTEAKDLASAELLVSQLIAAVKAHIESTP